MSKKNKIIIAAFLVISIGGGYITSGKDRDHTNFKNEVEKIRENLVIDEQIVNEYYEDKREKQIYGGEDKNILIHNNGGAIENNILIEKNGYSLIGIHKYIDDEYDYAEYFYSKEEYNNIDNIKKSIKKFNVENRESEGTIIRKNNWSYKEEGEKRSIVEKFTLKRRNKDSNYNGIEASIWQINSRIEVEGIKLKELSTNLNLETFKEESLINYGLEIDGENNSLKRYNIKDMSSMYNNYTSWKFKGKILNNINLPNLNIKVDVTNTSDNLGVETSNIYKSNGMMLKTGISRFFVRDR